MVKDNLLPRWFIISIEIIGIILTALLVYTAIVQTIYLNKANDIQKRLVEIEKTHIFPETIKVVPTSPLIRGSVNETVNTEFEMAYDGERVVKYYIRWFAKSITGSSGGINYKTKDDKTLKIMHNGKNSIYESFDFSFERKGKYIVTANIYYSDEELISNDPSKKELDLLLEIGKPRIQNFDVEIE